MRGDTDATPPTSAGVSPPLLSLRARVCHPNTRTYVRLLGPCFKTGHLKPFCQHLTALPSTTADSLTAVVQHAESTAATASAASGLFAQLQLSSVRSTTHSRWA